MSILMNWSHIAISRTDALFEIFGSFLSYPLLFKQIWEYNIFFNTPNCFLLFISMSPLWFRGFSGSSVGKESACNAEDPSLIPGWERSPGGGHGNPLQYSCLENPHGQKSLTGYSPWSRRVRHNWVSKHSTQSWEQVGKILSSLYIQNNYMVAEWLVRDKVTQLESDRI